MKRAAHSKHRMYGSRFKNQERKISIWKNWFQFFVVVPMLVMCVFGSGLLTPKAQAASGINKQINFQGKLVDNNGLNVADSTYAVVFSLYTVSSGGSAAWTETDSVSTLNGVFQVALGAGTPFPGNIDFNSDTWYLGIKVGSDLEMTPRVRFSAVPYAFNAAALDGIVATNSASQFTITGGTNALLDLTVNGSLTLGSTIKPTAAGALAVQSNGSNGLTLDTGGAAALAIGATANAITFGATNNPTYAFSGTGAVTFQGTSFTLGNGATATIQTTSNAGLSLLSAGSGNITLGQNSGTGTVVVSPNAGGQASLIVIDQGSGDLFTASAGATTKFVIGNSGAITDLNYAGANAILYAAPTTGLVTTTTTTTGSQCLLSQAGSSGTPIWGGCGGASASLQTAYNVGQSIDLSQVGTGLTLGTGLGTQNVVIAPNAGGQAALIINKQAASGDIFTASASGSTKLVLSNAGNLGIGSGAPQEELTLGPAANLVGEMAVPTGATATVQTGGTLVNATYFYVVTASDGIGETIKSTETAGCTSTNAGGGQHTCLVAWSSVVGAVSYKVYRTITSGVYTGSTLVATVAATSFSDTGVTPAAGTPPSATTAYVTKFTFSGNSWLIGDNFGIGTTSPLASLHIKGGKSGGNAAAIFDQVGASTNDILTGSASGATKFIVHNDGSIQTIGGNATADITTITGGSGLTILPKANGAGAGGVLTVKGGNGSTTAGGLVLDSGTGSSGTISVGTANATGLTFGGSQNPSFAFNGTGAFTIAGGGNNNITFGSSTGTGTVVVQPNAGGQAAFIVNDQGSGDVLTASQSGKALFTVARVAGTPVNGFTFTGSTTTNPVAQTATGTDTNIGLTIDGKGTGTVTINGTATGGTTIGHGLTLTSGTTLTLTGDTVSGAPTWSSNQNITIGTAAQPNITSLGTLSSLGVTGALTSGALTVTSNSVTALAVGANGSTNPVFTVNAAAGSVVTGLQVLGAATGGTTALTVTDSGSNANLSLDAKGTGTIAIGTASSGSVTLGGGSGASTIIIGGSANGLTFSTSTGPSYAGTGRPIKKIVLSAEYPGAVLTASASAATTGNMTSDASPSAITNVPGSTPTTFSYENYYQWAATTLGADQRYTVAVRVTLPKDFSNWVIGTSPYALTIDFNTAFTTASLNSLDVYIYQYGDISSKPIAFRTGQASATSKNWTQVTIPSTDLTGGTVTWDSTHPSAIIFLTLHSTNTPNYVQVGDITLNYLAAF